MNDAIVFSVRESPEGGYEARALGFPIFTQGESMEDLRAMLEDAVRCHFDNDRLHSVVLMQP